MFGNPKKRQKIIKFKKIGANERIESSDEEEVNTAISSLPSVDGGSVVSKLSSAQSSAQQPAQQPERPIDEVSEPGNPVNNDDPYDFQVAQGVEQMNGVQPTFYNFDKRIYDHVNEFETSDKRRFDQDLIFIRLVAGGLDKSFVDEDIIKIFKKKKRIRRNNNTTANRQLWRDNESTRTPVNQRNQDYQVMFNTTPGNGRQSVYSGTEETVALDTRQGQEEKSVTTDDQNPPQSSTYVYYYRYSDQLFNAWSTAIVAVRKMLRRRERISLQAEFEGLIRSDSFTQAFANYVVFLIRKEKLGFIVDRRQTTFEINRDAQDEDRYLYPLMSSLKYDFLNNKLREDLSRSIYGERA